MGWTIPSEASLGRENILDRCPLKGQKGKAMSRYSAQVLSNMLVLAADESAGGRLLTTRDIVGDGEELEELRWESVQI